MRRETPADKSNYTTFYIVRHGQTDWNVKKLMQGQTDIALNAQGESEARQLAGKLKDVPFHGAYSSDLLRAKRTAELIALEKNIIVKTTEALRERRFGRFEGRSYSDYRNELKDLLEKFEQLGEEEKVKYKPEKDIESDEEVISRFTTFLREIAVAYTSKTVLMVTHGSMIRALLIHMGFTTYKDIDTYVIKNTAYFKLLSDGVDFFIEETFGIDPIE